MIKKAPQPFPALESVFVEDPFPAGFVHVFDPTIKITTEPSFNGRYGFRLQGETTRIRAAFEALSKNSPIGGRDLIDAVKKMRTAIFTAKSARSVRI